MQSLRISKRSKDEMLFYLRSPGEAAGTGRWVCWETGRLCDTDRWSISKTARLYNRVFPAIIKQFTKGVLDTTCGRYLESCIEPSVFVFTDPKIGDRVPLIQP